MESAQEFAFTSRLTSGLSFDKIHYDILTAYCTPCANLPRSAAQQIVRARDIKFRGGFITVADSVNTRMISKPLGYKENKRLCLARENFSLNLLDD